jgi:nicotinate-nucleotide adenylyltransferase
MGLLVRDRLPLSEVRYLPAPVPPHKSGTFAPFEDRLEMTRRLVAGHEGLVASDLEARLPPPHYTVRTLRHLASGPLSGHLFLVIGADSLAELHLWSEYPELFSLATVVALGRAGWTLDGAGIGALAERVVRVEDYSDHVSSTDLRRRLAGGESPPEVPAAVLEYIREKNLYAPVVPASVAGEDGSGS